MYKNMLFEPKQIVRCKLVVSCFVFCPQAITNVLEDEKI